jgi:hypothetical protein
LNDKELTSEVKEKVPIAVSCSITPKPVTLEESTDDLNPDIEDSVPISQPDEPVHDNSEFVPAKNSDDI